MLPHHNNSHRRFPKIILIHTCPKTPESKFELSPTEGGSIEQPPTLQDDEDNQGGGLPTIKNEEDVPLGDGVAEQPQDDGQEDSSEGAETAGPLT
jgi:hypothetical protein